MGLEQVVFTVNGISYLGVLAGCGEAMAIYNEDEFNKTRSFDNPLLSVPLPEDDLYRISLEPVQIAITAIKQIQKQAQRFIPAPVYDLFNAEEKELCAA